MLKNRLLILVIILNIVVSCTSTLNTIKTTNDLDKSISYVVDYINKCIDGSNQVNVDEKAIFDRHTKTLIIYKGASTSDFFQKWEMPLADLDPNTLMIDESEFGGNKVTVFTINKQEKIKFYEKGHFSSTTEQSNYYLGFCWKNEKEKQYFIESYRRAIILSKKK